LAPRAGYERLSVQAFESDYWEENMKKRIALLSVFAALFATASTKLGPATFAAAPDPGGMPAMLTGVHVSFDSKEAKAAGDQFDVSVTSGATSLASGAIGAGVAWDAGSQHEGDVTVTNPVSWEDSEHGSVTIHYSGSESHGLNAVVTLSYQRDGMRRLRINNFILTGGSPNATFSW
jgi:hypothetical protein